ncbi:hypothetical protein GUA46_06850 [Muricauda sp. HICW]|uniref:Uncharacterized protein n=1 Tax=Flagellimonas chongwuensis TaxID=2697365 RepID=A0A850NHS7_9FLAO|nr:hypothetical protein [Allomuricauda chongwuensis]NVN18052.1 hypothetical protein [Allomuricauda chongwuensis]
MNKNYLKAGFLILFLAIILFMTTRSNNIALKQDINGVIISESIYGGKGDVKVRLNSGKEYLLDLYSVKSDDSVITGDSLFKRKGEPELYHFKKDSSGAFKLYDVYRHTTFFD